MGKFKGSQKWDYLRYRRWRDRHEMCQTIRHNDTFERNHPDIVFAEIALGPRFTNGVRADAGKRKYRRAS